MPALWHSTDDDVDVTSCLESLDRLLPLQSMGDDTIDQDVAFAGAAGHWSIHDDTGGSWTLPGNDDVLLHSPAAEVAQQAGGGDARGSWRVSTRDGWMVLRLYRQGRKVRWMAVRA
jgi:hypothetical protein